MVSVIMAVYNIGDMSVLQKSIDSVLSQSVKDLELIICDDCSDDGTFEYVRSLTAQDNRIIVLRNDKNMKPGYSRNRCMEKARGDFIAIMDGDDISASERLSKQVEFLEANPEYDFVGVRSLYFKNTIGDCGERCYPFYPFPQKKDFLITLPFMHPTLMFRKSVFDVVNGYSTEKLVTRSEDTDMLLKMYEAGFKGANIDEVLYYYRLDTKKRKYRYRFNETAVKWRGFYRCGLFPRGIPFALKPLVVGLVSDKLLDKMKLKYYGN